MSNETPYIPWEEAKGQLSLFDDEDWDLTSEGAACSIDDDDCEACQ